MGNTRGMERIGPGRANQQTVMDYLVQEVQHITNDVRVLSLIGLANGGVQAYMAMLRSQRQEASTILDELTLDELERARDAAIDLAIMCRKKILERE